MQDENKKTEIQEILEIVKGNKAEIQSVSVMVKDSRAEIQSVLEMVKDNKTEIRLVSETTKDNKTEIQAVLEIVNFIKDNAASQAGVDALTARVSGIENRMVTKEYFKEYLDDKLADLRGDLVVLTRKEDFKVRALVEVMAQKQLLSKDEANKILSMEPFPQLAL